MAPPHAVTSVVFSLDDGGGAEDFSCSVSRAEFVPSPLVNNVRTFCGPKNSVGASSWNLEIEGLQDYFQNASLASFLTNNEGETATALVTWTSSEVDGTSATMSGTVRLVAVPFGGAADDIASFTATLPVDGTPALTPNIIAS